MAARAQDKKPRPQQFYLFQFSYSADAWAAMLTNPAIRNRISAVDKIVQALGGCFPKIVFPCFEEPDPPVLKEKWVSFGDHDVVTIIAFPDDERAAAFAMKIAAGGGVVSFKTTKIMPWTQAMSAMALAVGAQLPTYAPPGKPKRAR